MQGEQAGTAVVCSQGAGNQSSGGFCALMKTGFHIS